MRLLKTLAELKDYVSIDCKDIPPAIQLAMQQVETDCIQPLLGAPLFAWLRTAYETPGFDRTAADVLAAELLRLVQPVIGRIGTADGLTGHQVSIDNTGVHIMSTETSKTAFPWQVNQLRAALERRGFSDLDVLVQWLEDNRDAAPELQAWAASAAGQRHRQELFTCTADFQQYENISASRPVFLALGPVRRRLERFELGRVLGVEFLQELRDQVRERTLASENRNLLSAYVYPALASLTIGHAISEVGLKLTGDGVELAIARDDDSNSKEADAGLDALLQKKMHDALDAGARYLRQLTSYLDRTASATRFATYFHSSAYTAPAPPPVINSATSRTFKFC